MLSRYIDNFDYSSRFRILKGGKISLVVSALLASVTLSFASPVGEQIVSGNVAIDRTTPNTTNITQSTNKSIINWQSFNVAGNETVNFNMPSSTSSSLNRVVGNNKSEIYGKINSNGQVFLVNQNGIYFSKDAQVNTAGFVASTRDISDENFNNLNYIFEGNSDASIINLGTITTDNAYTVLLAKKVENEGVIKAHLGSVQLASGEKFTLDINGNSLVKLTIDKGTLDGLVANKGAIIADGGEIYLTTSALDTVLNGLVNNTGIIQANSVEEKDGKIILFAHGGTGEFGGSIEANGGFVETSGKEFVNKADLTVKAKEWLIDPVNITIGDTLASSITSALGSGDVTITTTGSNTPDTSSGQSGSDGDIFINSNMTWSANKLTLQAKKDIVVNSTLDISGGTAKLDLGTGWDESGTATTDYASANGKLIIHGKINAGNKTGTGHIYFSANDITLIDQMSDIANSSSGKFALAKDIDMNGVAYTPIISFSGTFDGLGNVISNLTYNNSTTSNVGLFGSTSGAVLSNIRLTGVNINAKNVIGSLVGVASNTAIYNSHASGVITSNRSDGAADSGGLVGDLYSGSTLNYSSANVNITGIGWDIGGLVGYINDASSVNNSFARGNVEVTGIGGEVGGIVGGVASNSTGGVYYSYATGNVKAAAQSGTYTGAGGIVGAARAANTSFEVEDSYYGGVITVAGGTSGDIIGNNAGSAVITRSIKTTSTAAANYSTINNFLTHYSILEGFTTPLLKAQNSNAFMINGNLIIEQNPTITLSQDIDAVAVTGSDTLTLKSQGDIVLTSGSDIRSNGGKLNTVFWADSDGNNDGGVVFKTTNTQVTTNGGHIWIGGGIGSTTWNNSLTVGNSSTGKLNNHDGSSTSIVAAGINMHNAVINAGSGDIYMNGKSGQTTYQYGIGTRVAGTTQIIGNNITLKGIGSANASTYGNNWGVGIEHTTQVTATGNIIIEGTGGGSSSTGANNYGVNIAGSAIVQSSGGYIDITGTGEGQNSQVDSTNNDGVSVSGSAQIITASGAITLTGTKGQNTSSEGLSLAATDTLKQIKSTNGGTITLITDDLTIGSTQRLSSSGNLIIKPKTANTTIGIGGATGILALASSYFSTNFVDGFSGITIGSSDQTGAIAIGATAISDALTLYTKGSVTQSGAITGNQNLNLLGTNGIYTLNNTANNINTLTANTGSVTYIDSDALTLGAITATGVVNVATQTGNMTLNGNIATTDTTSSAITLNAGKNTAAGTSTGGNIIHTSGTITTGTNGRATLYSGDYTSGNGFDLLVSSNNYRKFNADETTVFNPALGSGKYLVYRENTLPITTPTPSPKNIDTIVNSLLNNITKVPATQTIPKEQKIPSSIVKKDLLQSAQSKNQISVTDTILNILPELKDNGKSFTIVSKANEEQVVSKITMDELLEKTPNSEIRIALSNNSFTELINGGVNLPAGISQEFYIVEEKE